MANKVPFYATWSLKNVLWAFFAVLLGIGVLAYNPIKNQIRAYQLARYKGEAVATITKVQENKRFSQSYDGNKVIISSYSVSYTYEVGRAIIDNTEIIDPQLWAYHKIAISRNTSLIPYKVKYNLDNHWDSILVLYDLVKQD